MYFIIKLHVTRKNFCLTFTACVHVSVMGSCSTSKVEEFPLLAEKISCRVAILFGYRMLPMVMAFSKALSLALALTCHICVCACTHTHTEIYIVCKGYMSFCVCLVVSASLAICYWPQLESGK